MKNQPLVSILIPTYNCEVYLSRAIESALRQTYENIEIIISDNASEDRTYEVAEKYSRNYDNIRLYSNRTNIGPVRNWRQCALMASGDYASLLFADDWYEDRFIERTLQLLRKPNVGFVFTAVKHVVSVPQKRRSHKISYLCGAKSNGLLPSNLYLEAHLYLSSLSAPLSPGSSICQRKDLLRWLSFEIPDPINVGFMEHGAGPDVLINLYNASQYPFLGYIDDPLVNYLLHSNNLSNRPITAYAYLLAKKWFFHQQLQDRMDPKKHAAYLFWNLMRQRKLTLNQFCDQFNAGFSISWSNLFQFILYKIFERPR